MYAIIATGGKQYKVSEGDVIRVEKLGVEADETVTFDQVLAVRDDETLKVGKDVENATVSATCTVNGKGKRSLSISTRERPDITAKTVTDSSTQK